MTLSQSIPIMNDSSQVIPILLFIMAGMLPWVLVETSDGIGFSQVWGDWLFFIIIQGINGYSVISSPQGFSVSGLTKEEIETKYMEWFGRQSYFVSSRIGNKKYRWREIKDVTIIAVGTYNTKEEIWLMGRKRNVAIYVDSARGRDYVKQFLRALRKEPIEYVFKYHASGLIYFGIAAGLLIFGWIKYIKPLLVLVD